MVSSDGETAPRPTGDENAARLERIEAAFERASRTTSPVCCTLDLCGQTVRLRIAGSALGDHIFAPLAHHRLDDDRVQPQLTIDLWDAHETAVAGPGPGERHATGGQQWEQQDGSAAVSGDGRFVSHELRGSFVWLDRIGGRIRGWFEDSEHLSLHERGKPLQTLLAIWCGDRGMQPAHAGLVAREGRGVVVPGASGSGKSTVSLACLQAGFGYAGDDWIALEREADGGFRGYGLYGSAFLETSHAERFPRLFRDAIPPRLPQEFKSLVLLAREGSARLVGSASIRAIALPRVVQRQTSTIRRASQRDAMLMLAPSSILALRPRSGRDGVERLARFVERVPAYWLEIGSDVADIPRRVDDILADLGA